jgi:hypothetical protein
MAAGERSKALDKVSRYGQMLIDWFRMSRGVGGCAAMTTELIGSGKSSIVFGTAGVIGRERR